MKRVQILAAIADERRRVADLLDELDDSQLAAPSLCAGWDVKTVCAHLLSFLAEGTLRMTLLGVRRGSPDRAIDELARRRAELSAGEIAAGLRSLADQQYWRPPPRAPGLLAEVMAHSGDMRIPLGFAFEPDPQRTAVALDFLTGPVPIGLVPLRRLRGLRLRATDIDRAWGTGPEIRGRAGELMMAAVGRVSVFDELEGPGLSVLRQRLR
ncbi:hypothetical protein AU195_12765 [Mycobacterium sp. IS-1496]|uniref:maleylpyruvate isomerase family mycothiol-dependent enzyme n=1 Tax=Mycobacterium sp. IS-1496 TaxID=1772284 RepID=UPI000741635D|nr:maleylpyruvate isomerase family mycothiol-dependent enzyme [Mycobacterium sp. IS-1496]KUI36503.1 hypothetical protein AU195_12765 [Mycobacterium sp. IS-1496]